MSNASGNCAPILFTRRLRSQVRRSTGSTASSSTTTTLSGKDHLSSRPSTTPEMPVNRQIDSSWATVWVEPVCNSSRSSS